MTDKVSGYVFLLIVLKGITVQIDSVSLQSLYNVRLNDNGRIQDEDREKLRNSPDATKNPASSPTEQGEPVALRDMLANNTTLNQLLEAGSQPSTPEPTNSSSVQIANLGKPEPNKMPELSEDAILELEINFYARKAWARKMDAISASIRDAIKSGQYKAVADEKVNDLLGSVNALFEDAQLTKEQSNALETFNLTVWRLANGFGASYGYNKEYLLTGLQSAFDTLAESFNSVMGSIPKLKHDLKSLFTTKVDQLQNALEDIVKVPDLTKADVVEIINSLAKTEEQKQRIQELMPQIIERLATYDE